MVVADIRPQNSTHQLKHLRMADQAGQIGVVFGRIAVGLVALDRVRTQERLASTALTFFQAAFRGAQKAAAGHMEAGEPP